MWRRQLSTFDRSSIRGSSRMGVVVSLMATQVRAATDEPSWALLGQLFVRESSSLGAADRCGRGISAQELLQARFEHAALRLDVGAEILDPPPHLALELAQALILCSDELVVPSVELLSDVRDPVLEPLRARVADVRQPFREHRLGLPREGAHRAVELAGETLRSVLPRGLHELREPLRGLVRMGRHRSVDSALELLDLPAGDVLEAGFHALYRVDFLALRLLGQLALPAGHPLLELVQRPPSPRLASLPPPRPGHRPPPAAHPPPELVRPPPTLGRVCLELAAHEAECIVDRAVELGAQPRPSGPLLLAFGREPLGVRREPQLDLAQHLLLPLLELRDPHLGRLGDSIEILRPPCEPLLDVGLNLVQLLAESHRRVVFPLRDERSPLLRDLPLLLLQ